MSCSRCCAVLFALALSLSACSIARSQVIYDQPPISINGPTLPFPVVSQNDPRFGNFATAYDDFKLTSAALITDLHWQGEYSNFDPPDHGQVTGFTFRFYQDNGGLPGSVLLSESLPDPANETFVGTDIFNDPVYHYDADLPTPFAASAGTRYWLSIVADLTLTRDLRHMWGWYYGTGGNGIAWSDYFGSLNNPVPSDLAFSLTSHAAAATPEPSAITMLVGGGLAGSVFLRRKRKS